MVLPGSGGECDDLGMGAGTGRARKSRGRAWVSAAATLAIGCSSARPGDDDGGGDGDAGADLDGDVGADGDAGPPACEEWSPTSWSVDVLQAEASAANNLVVDASGVAHATFMTWWEDVRYARHEAGAWSLETAFRGGHPGRGIAVDREATVHFAAGRWVPGGPGNQTLFHVSNPGGQWTSEEIGMAYTGLAFGRSARGVAGVAYGGPHGELLVSSNEGGTWSETTVDADADWCCDNVTLAVDGGGSLHVAYFATLRELRYATDASGAWEVSTVGLTDWGGVGGELHPRLILDSNGRAHVAYEAPGLIVTAILEGGQVVDETPHALDLPEGTVVAFALELPDVVHVAGVGFGDPPGMLRYATDRLGAFEWIDVAEVEDFFAPPLLGVDRASSPWILYTAMANGAQSVIATAPDGPWCP